MKYPANTFVTPLTNFLQIIEDFDSITLPEMGKVTLLNRTDVKFVFHRDLLSDILLLAKDDYRSLVINEQRYADYNTYYFDTADYSFYLDHHNKRLNRFKVRTRSYVDSDLHFFEIKFKSNKGRTIKSRIKIAQPEEFISDECAEFLKTKSHISSENLKRSIQVKYKRITLTNREMTERITIDFDMSYLINDAQHEYPDLVILEVKQNKSTKSRLIEILHQQHLHRVSLSKYCFGIASFVDGIKRNNFKNQIRYVKKICDTPLN